MWRFLKVLEIEIPFDPAIPLLGIYPKASKSLYYKDICTCMFTVAQFTIAKTSNQPKCPSMIYWIKKMWYMYTMEYYSAIKKKHPVICNNMDGTRGHHVKWKKTGTERQVSHVLIYLQELTIKTIELMELESRMLVTRDRLRRIARKEGESGNG